MISIVEKELKDSFVSNMSKYVADIIAITYKYRKNKHNTTFERFYSAGSFNLELSKEETETMYEGIEDILQYEYGLIRINEGYDKPLVLRDLNEEE